MKEVQTIGQFMDWLEDSDERRCIYYTGLLCRRRGPRYPNDGFRREDAPEFVQLADHVYMMATNGAGNLVQRRLGLAKYEYMFERRR